MGCPPDEAIARLTDSRFPTGERATMLPHLEACARCRELAALLVATDSKRAGLEATLLGEASARRAGESPIDTEIDGFRPDVARLARAATHAAGNHRGVPASG